MQLSDEQRVIPTLHKTTRHSQRKVNRNHNQLNPKRYRDAIERQPVCVFQPHAEENLLSHHEHHEYEPKDVLHCSRQNHVLTISAETYHSEYHIADNDTIKNPQWNENEEPIAFHMAIES